MYFDVTLSAISVRHGRVIFADRDIFEAIYMGLQQLGYYFSVFHDIRKLITYAINAG